MKFTFRQNNTTKIFNDARIVGIEFDYFPNSIVYFIDYTESSFIRATSRLTVSVPHNPKFDEKIIIDKDDILKKVQSYVAHTHATTIPVQSIHDYVVELLLGEYDMVEKKSSGDNEPNIRELADTFIDMLTVVPQIIKSGGKPKVNKSGNEVLKETARKIKNRPPYPPKHNSDKRYQMINIDKPMTMVVPEPNGTIQIISGMTVTGMVVGTTSVSVYYTRSNNPCGASPMECVISFGNADVRNIYNTIAKCFGRSKADVIDLVTLQEMLVAEFGK